LVDWLIGWFGWKDQSLFLMVVLILVT
jgi:hypothetical protein